MPPGTITIVLDCSLVSRVDITAAAILRALARTLKARGVAIELAELRDEVVENLKVAGAEQELGAIVAHRTIEDCLAQHSHRRPPPSSA